MAEERKRDRYSYIYNDVVENEQDFVGLVAYSIYKKEKIQYIRSLEKKLGRSPEPSELEDFNDQAAKRLEQYRELATQRVNKFCEDILGQAIEDHEQMMQSEMREAVKKLKPVSWWVGFCQSLTASVVYSLLIGALITFLVYSQKGVSALVTALLNPQQAISAESPSVAPSPVDKTP